MNILKESEAKKKICPHLSDSQTSNFCHGSGCMAWINIEQEPQKDEEGNVKFLRTKFGYCQMLKDELDVELEEEDEGEDSP